LLSRKLLPCYKIVDLNSVRLEQKSLNSTRILQCLDDLIISSSKAHYRLYLGRKFKTSLKDNFDLIKKFGTKFRQKLSHSAGKILG